MPRRLYFVLVYHLTNLYFTKHHDFERFILLDGGIYTALFWVGQMVLGGIAAAWCLLLHPRIGELRGRIAPAALLVVGGGFAQMYVTIIGGQAFPLVLFPGRQVSSSFHDGVVHRLYAQPARVAARAWAAWPWPALIVHAGAQGAGLPAGASGPTLTADDGRQRDRPAAA